MLIPVFQFTPTAPLMQILRRVLAYWVALLYSIVPRYAQFELQVGLKVKISSQSNDDTESQSPINLAALDESQEHPLLVEELEADVAAVQNALQDMNTAPIPLLRSLYGI